MKICFRTTKYLINEIYIYLYILNPSYFRTYVSKRFYFISLYTYLRKTFLLFLVFILEKYFHYGPIYSFFRF
jgi:hypothetical protein